MWLYIAYIVLKVLKNYLCSDNFSCSSNNPMALGEKLDYTLKEALSLSLQARESLTLRLKELQSEIYWVRNGLKKLPVPSGWIQEAPTLQLPEEPTSLWQYVPIKFVRTWARESLVRQHIETLQELEKTMEREAKKELLTKTWLLGVLLAAVVAVSLLGIVRLYQVVKALKVKAPEVLTKVPEVLTKRVKTFKEFLLGCPSDHVILEVLVKIIDAVKALHAQGLTHNNLSSHSFSVVEDDDEVSVSVQDLRQSSEVGGTPVVVEEGTKGTTMDDVSSLLQLMKEAFANMANPPAEVDRWVDHGQDLLHLRPDLDRLKDWLTQELSTRRAAQGIAVSCV